ncbi:hypothetical protein OHB12_05230 [Nocardia sp. NBC_01730]|uniref:hypothetical protein n=1 Tax=Nocardia sp. NBC_01730 TaxID=2975998 RepID=UPI002E14071B|nr:hypothetical protein OHB12_05230 [Nocardia sp. NBC_01730]
MSSPRPPRSPRKIRSPEVVERLERSRLRVRERRALARQRERTIADAVKRYVDDWQAIAACEAQRDTEIETLREQIHAVESRTAEEVARHRADQAAAAVAIRDQGQTDEDVAELLELDTRQARQLINAGRAQRNTIPMPTATATSHREDGGRVPVSPGSENHSVQVSAPHDSGRPPVPSSVTDAAHVGNE